MRGRKAMRQASNRLATKKGREIREKVVSRLGEGWRQKSLTRALTTALRSKIPEGFQKGSAERRKALR